ncbi:MAG: tyrosine-type recombinase/integrase [Tateyamaria sp.]
MSSGLNRISTANTAKALGLGKHADGGGLYLYHTKRGRSWVMRYTIAGVRTEIGLGGFEKVSLSAAREQAAEIRRMLEQGKDPKSERAARKQALKESVQRNAPKAKEYRSLENVIARTFEAEKPSLKGAGSAGRWLSPLKTHIIPKLRDRDVETITAQDVAAVLRPIWHTRQDVARKAAQRLGKALAYARAEGMDVRRDVIADARDILGRQVLSPKKIPAMHWRDVPTYYAKLGEGSVDWCLRLVVLTAVRSRPARLARVDQFKADTWVIPALNMKGSEQQSQDEENDFHVPLSPEAQAVIEAAKPYAVDGFLFCGPKGKPISDMAMSARMRRDKMGGPAHWVLGACCTWLGEKKPARY